MTGDPILARRDKRTLPEGCELGLPNNCQLGTLNSNGRGDCGRRYVAYVAGVRLCEKHLRILKAIVRDVRKAVA